VGGEKLQREKRFSRGFFLKNHVRTAKKKKKIE
jgi:hypothetical protein